MGHDGAGGHTTVGDLCADGRPKPGLTAIGVLGGKAPPTQKVAEEQRDARFHRRRGQRKCPVLEKGHHSFEVVESQRRDLEGGGELGDDVGQHVDGRRVPGPTCQQLSRLEGQCLAGPADRFACAFGTVQLVG